MCALVLRWVDVVDLATVVLSQICVIEEVLVQRNEIFKKREVKQMGLVCKMSSRQRYVKANFESVVFKLFLSFRENLGGKRDGMQLKGGIIQLGNGVGWVRYGRGRLLYVRFGIVLRELLVCFWAVWAYISLTNRPPFRTSHMVFLAGHPIGIRLIFLRGRAI